MEISASRTEDRRFVSDTSEVGHASVDCVTFVVIASLLVLGIRRARLNPCPELFKEAKGILPRFFSGFLLRVPEGGGRKHL